ncbi:MAG: S-layer homology domain-containing protein [Clostridia bacterium]
MKRWFAVLLAMMLLITAVPFAHAASFSDVPRSHWAYEAISEMADQGIIKGYNDGTFRPDNQITRAEFAKIMIAAAGIDLGSTRNVKQTFDDVSRDHWAFLYVERAKNYLTGYKSGTRYTYKPNEAAVREDIAVALVRLMQYDQTKRANDDLLDRFRDKNQISKQLRPYIAIAVDTDLIKGFNDRTFRPQAPITRAEAAMLIYRAKEKLDETKVVFPVEPETPKPEEPKIVTISDNFSDSKLKNWNQEDAYANWLVSSQRVTAYSENNDLDHYLLPLSWEDVKKAKEYEMQVDVTAEGNRGFGGLFFNGSGKQATVVYVDKDTLYVKRVTDPNSKDTSSIAKVNVKSQKTNKIKVKVKDGDYSVYLNGSMVYSQEGQDLSGTKLGLYLNAQANDDFPKELTTFDNFYLKATMK